jgi:hypothetical protein
MKVNGAAGEWKESGGCQKVKSENIILRGVALGTYIRLVCVVDQIVHLHAWPAAYSTEATTCFQSHVAQADLI